MRIFIITNVNFIANTLSIYGKKSNKKEALLKPLQNTKPKTKT